MADRFTILAVCAGNIHRSPLAAALLDRWRTWYLPPSLAADVEVRSAGLVAPAGAPMGSRAQRIARALGADGSDHQSTELIDSDITAASLILVATVRQRDIVIQRVPTALRKTFTIREAGRISSTLGSPSVPASPADLTGTVAVLAARRGPGAGSDDIIDPQGLGDDAYLQMAQEEVGPLASLAHVLFGMPPPDVAAYVEVAESPGALTARLRRAERGA